ncbi:MAG: hypothetical protein J6W30_02000 [Bacteroidales bacterium]|nr:hypothetical protein [Bacteroidales bacterium]
MKKLALTIAIFLGISLSTYAQGGLFQYGETTDENKLPTWYSLDQNGSLRDGDPLLPGLPGHGEDENQGAPLGSGAMLLIGFGAAYALKKRNEK